MRKNGKLFAALLCLLLLCALCLPALAVEVDYIYYTWDKDTKVLTRHDGKCLNATVLKGDEETLSEGWYVTAGDVSFSRRPVVFGDVGLILTDGYTVKAEYGITVEGNNTLSIYAQSEDEGMGALTVPVQYNYDAGIGGTSGNSSGLITIHGGTVTATGDYGAGIGGGYYGSGEVTIYGGTVTAETSGEGAGIGGGEKGDGTVEIYGGTVLAHAYYYGAGIGGGFKGSGEVTICGGTVTATASSYRAAIGNGGYGSSGEVTITGGRVSAQTIGGDGCAVSLGWKDADDYIDAAGYLGSVKLTKDFLIAGTTTMLPAGTVEDLSEIAGQVLLPGRSRTVRCIGYEWDEGKKRLVRNTYTVRNPRPLTGLDTVLTGGDKEENAVWYKVSGAMTLFARPEVSGHVHLILMDGCDLRAEKGITVNEGNFLSIFAQREGEGMGALTVPDQGNDAGIGGTEGNSSGLITIHGGTVTATGLYGAGIGGGGSDYGQGGSGEVTIYGGTVTATANDCGAGIGGGGSYDGQGGSGNVTIYGGKVTATTSDWGAGIGGGYKGNGEVTINGGTVSATASYSGAGIGGGSLGSGTVTIHGGTVTATGLYGAGIGGGYHGEGKVEISGGAVTATASGDGAAIGNGVSGSGGSVTITGGSVSAVHTVEPSLSIGGNLGECTVSLGITKKNDSVYAAGYRAKGNTVTLTAALQDAGTGEEFLAGGVPAGDVARKLLVPKGAAGQYAWSGAAFRLPGSLGEIGKGAFQSIRAATVLVPQTVKKIGADAFRGSGVKRIKFENGGTEVDPSAFADCPFVIVYTPEKGSVYDALKDVLNVYLMPVK